MYKLHNFKTRVITTGDVDSEKTGSSAIATNKDEAENATVVRVVTDVTEVEGKFC